MPVPRPAGEASVIEDGFADVPEAARFLKVSRSKVYMMMDNKELPYAKFGRSRRIPRKALMEYARSCLVGA
jgi:excisionase family DNA binding protein